MTETRQWQLETAAPEDAPPIHGLRRQLEDWLYDRGIEQWPRGEVSFDRIASEVERAEWRRVRLPDLGVVAAMRVLWSDPDFWGADPTPAIYVHGLMVDRSMARTGMGTFLLESAAEIGRAAGLHTFRLDCAESNATLRSYYGARGFHEVGRHVIRGLFPVVLFEKRI
ncbi:Acetyltransferase (GNAT) family protein [Actinopolyspora lacussalsi subsp. righensis]|uniref:Acetyltransferase (GNAT) family protein n=1 Tax=Actinopolyspora righensis TaxID=995060 RepID=A0A1I6XZW8_9ACTN|nr:GNAT family N-acetyltransferase [Actinopolyspora righensis]SFT43602.1 Acetyltransferase (GNAT) family protein [Actinopolyspora righensis]